MVNRNSWSSPLGVEADTAGAGSAGTALSRSQVCGAGQVRGETVLHFLAQRGVYVSSGSACGKAKPSHVLEAMGLPREQVQSALRVSFSRFSTQEDVDALAEGLKLGLKALAQSR